MYLWRMSICVYWSSVLFTWEKLKTKLIYLYILYCALYTVQCTVCILYSVHCILVFTVLCILYTVFCTLYTVQCTLFLIFFLGCIQYTLPNIFNSRWSERKPKKLGWELTIGEITKFGVNYTIYMYNIHAVKLNLKYLQTYSKDTSYCKDTSYLPDICILNLIYIY